jgi:hypothetical protein
MRRGYHSTAAATPRAPSLRPQWKLTVRFCCLLPFCEARFYSTLYLGPLRIDGHVRWGRRLRMTLRQGCAKNLPRCHACFRSFSSASMHLVTSVCCRSHRCPRCPSRANPTTHRRLCGIERPLLSLRQAPAHRLLHLERRVVLCLHARARMHAHFCRQGIRSNLTRQI